MPRLKFSDKTEDFSVGIFCRNKATEIYDEIWGNMEMCVEK